MTNNLKDMLNNIPIPDEIDESIELGFDRADRELRKKRSIKPLMVLAASLVIIISSMGIIGFDKVEAAIRKALQYVPGYNVVVDIEEGRVLALQDPVVYKEDDIHLIIVAASKVDKNFSLKLNSNYGEFDIGLKRQDGSIAYPMMTSIGSGGEYWHGEYYFELEDDETSYSLLIEDLEIPFTLEKTTEVENFLQLGNNATDKGISVVAIKKPRDHGLMISLLNQSEDKVVADYPFEGSMYFGYKLDREKSMYILDRQGEKTYPTIPSSFGNLMSDFYFDIEDQEGLKLVLPYININYPDLKTEKIKIKTPEDGEVESINKVLDLGKFAIRVIDVRGQGREIVLNLEYISPDDDILEYVNVMAGSGFNSPVGYGIGPDEDTGYMELYINREDIRRNFSIYFKSPNTLLLGDWVIDLD